MVVDGWWLESSGFHVAVKLMLVVVEVRVVKVVFAIFTRILTIPSKTDGYEGLVKLKIAGILKVVVGLFLLINGTWLVLE